MAYIELTFSLLTDEALVGLLSARLSMLGFDSFFEDDDGFKAYIQDEQFSIVDIENLLAEPVFQSTKLLRFQPLEDKNWNAIWESSYESVVIENQCYIRAPFHEHKPYPFEIVIEPKMSFGTAHHETTAQMIAWMLTIDFTHKSILDMGCGTAVLAILAKMKNASFVEAIDNDEWAYKNALENVTLNQVNEIKVVFGDATSLGATRFDVIFANINRNILLNDIPAYTSVLNPSGDLYMSGFYETDLKSIRLAAERSGLEYKSHTVKNQWVAVKFSLKPTNINE